MNKYIKISKTIVESYNKNLRNRYYCCIAKSVLNGRLCSYLMILSNPGLLHDILKEIEYENKCCIHSITPFKKSIFSVSLIKGKLLNNSNISNE
jgi:hypothetical protein